MTDRGRKFVVVSVPDIEKKINGSYVDYWAERGYLNLI